MRARTSNCRTKTKTAAASGHYGFNRLAHPSGWCDRHTTRAQVNLLSSRVPARRSIRKDFGGRPRFDEDRRLEDSAYATVAASVVNKVQPIEKCFL